MEREEEMVFLGMVSFFGTQGVGFSQTVAPARREPSSDRS